MNISCTGIFAVLQYLPLMLAVEVREIAPSICMCVCLIVSTLEGSQGEQRSMQGVHPEVHLREAEEYSYSTPHRWDFQSLSCVSEGYAYENCTTGVLVIVHLGQGVHLGSLCDCTHKFCARACAESWNMHVSTNPGTPGASTQEFSWAFNRWLQALSNGIWHSYIKQYRSVIYHWKHFLLASLQIRARNNSQWAEGGASKL